MSFTTNIQISKSTPSVLYDAAETSSAWHEDDEIDGAQDAAANATFVYASRVASHNAVDEVWGAAGGAIYIPTAALGVAGAIYVEISTAAFVTGTLRIGGEGSATLLQSVGRKLFVIAGAQDNGSAGQAQLERLAFRGVQQGRLGGHDASDAPPKKTETQKAKTSCSSSKSQSEERIVEQ
jgi:hypothetical protein